MTNYSEVELRDIWEYIRNNRDTTCSGIYEQIVYDINSIKQKKIQEEAHKEMMDFARNYDGCKYFKAKVANEGEEYFYNSYTNVSAPFDIFSNYAYDEDCWCGICECNDIDMKEELIEWYGESGYTYEALKRDFNTPKGIVSLLENMCKDANDKNFEALEELFESDECAYENENAKENIEEYMVETFLIFFEDSAYMKDKFRGKDLRKLYDSQDEHFRFNIPFLEFENCFRSDEEWNNDVKGDIDEIFTHFGCKNKEELKDKLKNESILSDEFVQKYFEPTKIYTINYTILKGILEE